MSQTSVAARLRAALDPFEGICIFVRSASGPVAKLPPTPSAYRPNSGTLGCNPDNAFFASGRGAFIARQS
jgi:hypothetical protein